MPRHASGVRAPRTVWAATIVLGLLGLVWAVIIPAYRTPDEPAHLSTALRLATGGGYPHPGSATIRPDVANSFSYADFPGADSQDVVAKRRVTDPHRDWPSWATLAGLPAPTARAAAQTSLPDQMTQHPPLWAGLAAAEIRGFGLDHLHADLALLILRLLQFALCLPLPWCCWRAATLVRAGPRAAEAVAFFPALLPQEVHVAAAVSNGQLLRLEFAVATVALLLVARGDLRARVLLPLAAATTAAMLTEAFGLTLLPATAVALAVGSGRLPQPPRFGLGRLRFPRPRPLTLALVLPVLAGGWWYVVRLVQDHAVQPSGYPAAFHHAWGAKANLPALIIEIPGGLALTAFFSPGWIELLAPVVVAVPLMLVLLWLIARGIKRTKDRDAVLTAFVPFPLVMGLLVVGCVATWRHHHYVTGTQGRYLFPTFVGLGAAIAASLDTFRFSRNRWAPAALPFGTLVFQAGAIAVSVWHFWGPSADGDRVSTMLHASLLPGWVLGVSAAVAAILLTISSGRLYARRPKVIDLRDPVPALSMIRSGHAVENLHSANGS